MKMKLTTLGLSVLLMICQSVTTLHADLVLSIEDVTAMPGDTAVAVGFFASNPDGPNEELGTFNFPTEIGGDGNDDISNIGLSFNAVAIQNALTLDIVPNFAPAGGPIFGYDIQIDKAGFPPVITINTGDTVKLFDLVFDVDSGAAPGVLPIDFVPSPFFNVVNNTGSAIAVTTEGGSIQVVPEPSFAAVAIALAGCSALRRRRG